MTRDSPRHVATPWCRIKKRLDCVDFHRARGLDTRTPPCSRDREYRRVPAAGAGTSVRLDEPARRSPRASARANAARRSAKTSRARRVGGCRRATTSHSRRRSTQKRRFATNVIDERHYGTRATRRKATEKTRKRTQRKGACNDASARARAFVGGADARRCVRRRSNLESRAARSRRRRACDSPRARAGGERRVNARITLRARARRARVARHPMDQSTRCRDADKNAKKTLD